MKKIATTILLLFCFFTSFSQDLKISEILASNTNVNKDIDGKYLDWFELHNTTANPIDLKDYYITDNPSNLKKDRFSQSLIVPAHGHIIIWCGGDANKADHTSFSLSSTDGEHIYLTAPDGNTIIDQVSFPPQFDNISYGRNSVGNWVFFTPPTPGSINNDAYSYNGLLAPPTFSTTGGYFTQAFNLSLYHQESGTTIYYTLDGSNPDPNNLNGSTYFYKNDYPNGNFSERSYQTMQYSHPIFINDRSSLPNQISTISSTASNVHPYKPSTPIKKGNIVRAIAVKPGFLTSEIITQTYLYHTNNTSPHTLPIVSLVTQEDNLFDYQKGIYTAGKNYDDFVARFPDSTSECGNGNFTLSGSASERSANLEFFGPNSVLLNQNIAIRIHGGCTRTFPYKSIRLYGKNKFDNFPFFTEHPNLLHNRVILRNSGNDQFGSLFKDVFVREWMQHLNFSSQNTRPSVLYLNGEYWGIHNIRERFDNHYLANKYGASSDAVDLREFNYFEPDEMSEGDDVHYWQMYNYIMNNSMESEANYNHASTLIDMESVIDFFVAQSYIGNIDWPQNNIRMWRSKNAYDPSKKYLDGRWRYIFYDTDRSLGEFVNAEHNDFIHMSERNNSELFVKLLTNSKFKQATINRLNDLLNTSLKYPYANNILNRLTNTFEPEIEQHIHRWKNLQDKNEWINKINKMDDYVKNRYLNIEQLITAYFNVQNKKQITLISNLTTGYIKINSINIEPSLTPGVTITNNQWSGTYHVEVPITIQAIPKKGYRFSHWIYNNQNITQPNLTITLTQDRTYQAVFIYTGISENPIPQLAAPLKDCTYEFNTWNANSPAGTYPKYGVFIHMNTSNPGINDIPQETYPITGKYNLTSQTRITGHGNEGFSFINTGDPNTGYPSGALGGYLMAINTTDLSEVNIDWTARTVLANNRKYNIRLLYRVGDVEEFKPLGTIYQSGVTNHSQSFNNIKLPTQALNKEYVQLLWQYYDTKVINSGSRDQLGITHIKIKGKVFKPDERLNLSHNQAPHTIQSNRVLNTHEQVAKYASGQVEFLPGFEVKPGATLVAEIKTCAL